jgi:hypothetical protein
MTRSIAPPSRAVEPVRRERASVTPLTIVVAIVIAVGILLPLVSTAVGLYDRVPNWGKAVHAVDAACATLVFALMLLAWRDRARSELSDEMAGLLAMFGGILFGVLWEVVEFVRDWAAYSDLQKSNADSMTDFLVNDIAAVLAALLAVRIYAHATSPADRHRLGGVAEWLVDGPSRLLDRYGLALTAVALGAIAATILALWFTGRPVPGFAIP